MTAIAERRIMAVPLAVLIALLAGVVIGTRPEIALVLFGLGALLLLTLVAPVTHLGLLLFLTAIVPYQMQNQFSAGSVGLVASDMVLLTGLTRAALVLAQSRLSRSELVGLGLTVVFLVGAFLQFLHGVSEGAGVSQAGDEFRTLLGFGAFLVALPIMLDEEARPRLLKALLALGLLLGAWGLLQWFVQLPYIAGAGIREGVAQTSSGRGQLQGGLYAFPLAVTLAFAALMSGGVRGTLARTLVIACITVNVVCVLLTFERTFWVVTIVACAFVVLKARRDQRLRAIVLAPVALMASMVPLAFLSPATLVTARERLLSINQYNTDSSVSYRVRESQQVIDEIAYAPVAGSGLGASIWWGRPASGVQPEVAYFAHNGYLWSAWKLGIPLAILLWFATFLAIVRRGRVGGDPVFSAVSTGAQASLLALSIAAITFPGVASKTITVAMGILFAFCALERVSRQEADADAAAALAR